MQKKYGTIQAKIDRNEEFERNYAVSRHGVYASKFILCICQPCDS